MSKAKEVTLRIWQRRHLKTRRATIPELCCNWLVHSCWIITYGSVSRFRLQPAPRQNHKHIRPNNTAAIPNHKCIVLRRILTEVGHCNMLWILSIVLVFPFCTTMFRKKWDSPVSTPWLPAGLARIGIRALLTSKPGPAPTQPPIQRVPETLSLE